ncbi:hypothetical protein FGF1_26900 [Flavobacteriaceae bacterium GF1]
MEQHLKYSRETTSLSNQDCFLVIKRNRDDFENKDKTKLLPHYIQQNYPKKITLDEVAQLLNMGKVFFDRFMKKKYQSYVY